MNESPQFPRLLGRYELVHLLGQGGMGEVYLAKISGAAGFEKPCIVKTILPALLKDRQFLDRFHHEAKVLVHLVHSSIAQVYDMGEAEGTYYMALEYVAGVDLAYLQEQARAQNQQLPVPVALLLGQRIAEGLGYAHRKTGPEGAPLGIVHRDVSPHNVMVSYEGEVKVIDFGLAKSAARSKYTLPSTVMGKLGYMSPEQVRAEPVDHRSDIYSCGVVVWELLAGQPLIAHGTVGEMMAAMSNPSVPALHELRPDVDPALDAVVRRALAPHPEARYARADDFARALNEHFLRTASSFGAEELGNFVRSLCPDAFASQRKLISRLTSSPGLRRTPLPGGTIVPVNTGIHSPMPAGRSPSAPGFEPTALRPGSDAGTGYEATLVRSPSSTTVPAAGSAPGAVPAETLQLEKSSGPGRKAWTVAIALGALGLIGATAGVTSFLMAPHPPEPPPHEWTQDGQPLPPRDGMHPPPPGGPHGGPGPGGEHRPPPGGPGPDGEHRPPPGGPGPDGEPGALAMASHVPAPGALPVEGDTQANPDEDAPEESAEQAEPEVPAVEAPPTKQATSHPRAAQKLVPADSVVVMKPLGENYIVRRGRLAGLSEGMVLQVVAAPVKDGKARLLGEATVVAARPLKSELSPDANVRAAGKVQRLLVLPATAQAGAEDQKGNATSEPKAPAASPASTAEAKPVESKPVEAVPVEAKPSAPRELNGRIKVIGLGPLKKIEITNSDSFAWSECILVTGGRDVYRLGGLASDKTQVAPLRDFRRGGSDVQYMERNRLGLFCAEGQHEFYSKDL